MEIEGRQGRYAIISRRRGSPDIEVTVLTPERPERAPMQVAARGDVGARRSIRPSLDMLLLAHRGPRPSRPVVLRNGFVVD